MRQSGLYEISDLSSFMKTKLLEAYDEYIQDANEENRYFEGWMPVCINEFLNCEFKEVITEQGYAITFKGIKRSDLNDSSIS